MDTEDHKHDPDTITINLEDVFSQANVTETEEHIKTFTVERTKPANRADTPDDPGHEYPRSAEPRKKKKKAADDDDDETTQMSVFKKLLIAALIVVFLFGITGTVVAFRMFSISLNKDDRLIARDEEDFVTDEYDKEYADENVFDVVEPEDVHLQLVDPIGDEALVNILLVGQDRRPGEERARSDAMIVCSINPETGKTALVSFLRDLYVTIPGYSDNRLNAAYAFGGFPLLKETLKANFGITVDGCFEADFDEFISIIDIIGGTDIDITAEEAKIIGDGAAAGHCHLSGKQTLTFARIRKIGSDFGRTERQRKVILACLEKARRLDVNQLLDLVKTAMPYLSTDLTTTQITKLITRLTPLLPKVSIGTYFIPANGRYTDAMVRGMAVLLPDLKANRDLLKNEYFPF